MQNRKKPSAPPLPLIIGGLFLVSIIGYGVFKKYGALLVTPLEPTPTSAPTYTPSPTPTPEITPMPSMTPTPEQSATPTSTPEPESNYDIPEIKANVTSVRLYEAGENSVPIDKRKYGTIFYAGSTRCVWIEVYTYGEYRKYSTSFTYQSTLYDEDASTVKNTAKSIRQASAGNSGYDFVDGFQFTTYARGHYRIEIRVRNKVIASKSFTVR